MTSRRFIDCHVHLWDVAQHDWYRSFPKAGDNVLGWKMAAPWQKRYLWQDYRESVRTLDLIKWVHVSAVDDAADVEAETAWITQIAEENGAPPFAIIGSTNPALPLAVQEASIERQMAHPGYRGLRILGDVDFESDSFSGLLTALAARNLIFELAVGHGVIGALAKCLARHPKLTVVLEHTGLPHGAGETAFREWSIALARLALLPNVICKLSGLMMTIHHPRIELFQKFFGECIRLFGLERCMFGTNFPVDLTYGPAEAHLRGFEAIASTCTEAEAEMLFAGTAERVYGI